MFRFTGGMLKALAVLGSLACPLLAHLALSEYGTDSLRVALLPVPLLLFAWWVIARAASKRLWLLVLLAAGVAVFLLERRSDLGLAVAYGVPHAAVYLFLLWLFGRTLLRGREPLVTRLSRRVHGALPRQLEAYTRRVTVAWCVFFALQVGVSILLFAFASLDAWSLFVNVLNVPLLALMFAGEFLYRVARYPHHPHASIARALRALARDAAISTGAKAR